MDMAIIQALVSGGGSVAIAVFALLELKRMRESVDGLNISVTKLVEKIDERRADDSTPAYGVSRLPRRKAGE